MVRFILWGRIFYKTHRHNREDRTSDRIKIWHRRRLTLYCHGQSYTNSANIKLNIHFIKPLCVSFLKISVSILSGNTIKPIQAYRNEPSGQNWNIFFTLSRLLKSSSLEKKKHALYLMRLSCQTSQRSANLPPQSEGSWQGWPTDKASFALRFRALKCTSRDRSSICF